MKRVLFCCSGILSILLMGCSVREAASIGIIGGADGPTAIYVTSKINWWSIFGTTIIIFSIIVGIMLSIKKRK